MAVLEPEAAPLFVGVEGLFPGIGEDGFPGDAGEPFVGTEEGGGLSLPLSDGSCGGGGEGIKRGEGGGKVGDGGGEAEAEGTGGGDGFSLDEPELEESIGGGVEDPTFGFGVEDGEPPSSAGGDLIFDETIGDSETSSFDINDKPSDCGEGGGEESKSECDEEIEVSFEEDIVLPL